MTAAVGKSVATIDFSADRWESVRRDARAWWEGTLERPLIQMTLHGRPSPRPPTRQPYHHFTAFYDLSVSAQEIVDAWDYELSRKAFLGDAFPAIWPNFGAGALAAFLGATLHARRETVWFHPPENHEVTDLRFAFDPANAWLQRVREVMQEAMRRWQGLVQVGMTDLGGALDVLSSFRPGEQLLLDLYDEPEAVKARTWEIHEAWWKAFDELDAVLRTANVGYTAWAPVFSETPYYMLQCDFAYMIGPDMFDEFVKPELAASCRRLDHAFYHLDGPGQLPHLDSLLEIEELKGVQWIPGDGQPPFEEWPDVYRRIREAGKLIQLFGYGKSGYLTLDRLVDKLGSAEGIVFITGAEISREDEIRRWLESWGVE